MRISIDEHGVLAAIHYLVGESQALGELPEIELTMDVRFERLPSLLEGVVFRIVQEALNNARRHSKARTVGIVLTQPTGEERLRIEIADDGVGFDQANVPANRFGLRGIVERARLFDGNATIDSAPGNGTRVVVELPLDGRNAYSRSLADL